MRCAPSRKIVLVIFLRFLYFGPFFGPFLGTLVENAKHKKVAPCNSLNQNPSINIWVLKMHVSKMYIFGAQLSSRGLVWYLLNSSKARALRGLDKNFKYFEDGAIFDYLTLNFILFKDHSSCLNTLKL